jgi:hypothetical protein
MWVNVFNRYTGKRRRMRSINYQLLLSKTLPNGQTVPNQGWEIESTVPVKQQYVPQEVARPYVPEPIANKSSITRDELEEMNVKKLVQFIKDNNLEVNTAQRKDGLINDIIAAI